MEIRPALPGFDGINRFIDKNKNMVIAKVLPGEFYVTRHNEMIATVLGSCIAACIWDEANGVGGMNHFMLPLQNTHHSDSWSADNGYACRYGNWAMEYLINEILKHGAVRRNLKAKVFGGGRIMSGKASDVGEGNIEFVIEYLHNENIKLVTQDTGGIYPRKVMFHPLSGRVFMKALQSLHNETIEKREKEYKHNIEVTPDVSGDIELF